METKEKGCKEKEESGNKLYIISGCAVNIFGFWCVVSGVIGGEKESCNIGVETKEKVCKRKKAGISSI